MRKTSYSILHFPVTDPLFTVLASLLTVLNFSDTLQSSTDKSLSSMISL